MLGMIRENCVILCMPRLLRIKFYLCLTFQGLRLIWSNCEVSYKDVSPIMLVPFFQISACTCPYTTESLWWRRSPPPAPKVVGSPPLHPPLHLLLPRARRTSSTAGQKPSFFHSRTPSLTGRAPRCSLTCWREGCSCGWRPTGYMLSACARDECTGRDPWLRMWINPTSWRRSSRANCLTPSNSLLVSTHMFLWCSVFTMTGTPVQYDAIQNQYHVKSSQFLFI